MLIGGKKITRNECSTGYFLKGYEFFERPI